ncbi:glycoside hydrolase family 42 [Hirschia litorea]|uniref:Glycoside hydrolase family 42 n=1 Tax=Hirschia litorea TaxID=1199156 RepID=A0ABW2IK50_9PROT
MLFTKSSKVRHSLRAALLLGVATAFLGCTPTAQNETAQSALEQSASSQNVYEQEALSKIKTLNALMDQARAKEIDVTREETVIWFAKEFLKFANWDEANKDVVAFSFQQFQPYREDKTKFAEELPDFERQKVIQILDAGIENINNVLDGKIKRKPVPKIDWSDITVGDNMLINNERPIFLYDYFSKSVGRPLTDTSVYNDYLGSIYHGGENLYPVDHDRAINSFLVKEDGTFDAELLREVTDIPDTHVGFLLYWNSGIPEWILKQEPEAALGRSLFTGFDIDNPLVREVWGKIVRKTGELTRGKKVSQLGYIMSNEPHWYSEKKHWTQNFKEMTSISSYTKANFKNWLKDKYNNNIDTLNANWKTQFNSFDNVVLDVPLDRATRGTPPWYDWSRYNMDRSIDWFTYLQTELHKVNPEADTHIKLQPNLFTENPRSHGIDVEALTELTTMIGDDAKTTRTRNLNVKAPQEWESKYGYFWEELSMSYDFLESVAPDKIHINSEAHFLSASWWRELDMPVDYVRNVFWLATIQGMDASMSWFWARDPDGSPEDRLEGDLNFFDPALAGSYAASVNMQPHVANEVTQVMMDLNAVSEEILAIREQRRPIRLFYSETSAINKNKHMTEQFEMYEALSFDGFPVGFATQKILQNQDIKNWDTVLVYETQFVTDTEFSALQDYLNAGGTIILDSETSLSKNEYGKKRAQNLNAGRGNLIRFDGHADVDVLRNAALEATATSRANVSLKEDNGTAHKGCMWRVVEDGEGGYLVNILNLGKHTAQLDLNISGAAPNEIIDIMTGQKVSSNFELKPNGVLLLKLKP